MAYNEGFRTGYESKIQGNPFSAIIKRVDEARARKLADQKDLRDLDHLFMEMGKKYAYDKKLEEIKGKEERLTEMFKGVSSGNIEVDNGMTDDVLGKSEQPQQDAQQDVQAQEPSKVLSESFGLGKGMKIKRIGSELSYTPEEALTKIPKGESPDDYLPQPKIRKVGSETKEIYIAEKKQKVPVKQLDDLRLLGINASDLARNLEVKKTKGIDTGPSLLNRPGTIADILGNITNKKDLLSFKAEVDKAFQKYRKETTGVQAGYKELNWLAPDFPKVTDEDDVFIQKSEDAINTVKKNQEMFLDYLQDNGYAVEKLRKNILGVEKKIGRFVVEPE